MSAIATGFNSDCDSRRTTIKKTQRVSATMRAQGLLFCACVLVMTAASAKTSCDFKGVSVGDKATPVSLMAAFGIKNYKLNPVRTSLDKTLDLADKYGFTAATEIEDWNGGPACDNNSCRIPFGVGVGNDNLPVSVFVSLREGRITGIDVAFNQTYWEEIKSILDHKYGGFWRIEQDSSFLITDIKTRKSYQVDRTTLTHRTNGTNSKTGDSCLLWAVNYDMAFTHHDPLGGFHSVFEIKLVSKNF